MKLYQFLALSSDWIILGATIGVAILLIILSIYFYNKNVNVRKYKRKLKYINKTKEKKYNANVFIDQIYNNFVTDDTNTFESLKKKGKRKVKKYIKFYQRSLHDLVEAKSNISPNKKQNKLVFIFKNKSNQNIGKFYVSQKLKKLKKQIDKHQLLFDTLAYLYELPQYIDTKKAYHLENHDNQNVITYQIVEEIKK
ncbi:MAG: hypothetical protein PF513_01025 [Tenericutes bacterium]|jgi:hypothetical protein|nr:hypothetical protein [Mycoplasmatota bacterium]